MVRSSARMLARCSSILLVSLLFTEPAGSATLTLLSDVAEPTGTHAFELVAVSPDGLNVYAGSDSSVGEDATIAVFSRDAGSGALAFVQLVTGGVGGLPAFTGLTTLAFSPDGETLYASSGGISTAGSELLVFDRDLGTGMLSLVQTASVEQTRGVVVSPDGEFVYSDSGVTDLVIWDRDPATGLLTEVQRLIGGTGGGQSSMAISSDGMSLYAGYVAKPLYEITVYERDPATGSLQKRQKVRQRMAKANGAINDQYVHQLAMSPDDSIVFARIGFSVANSDVLGTFERDPATGRLAFLDHLPVGFVQSTLLCARTTDGLKALGRIAIDPAGGRVFAVSAAAPRGVSTLAIDPTSHSVDFVDIQTAAALGAGSVRSLAISPDGAHLYVSTNERTVETYGIGASPTSLLERPCKLWGTSLIVKNGAFASAKLKSVRGAIPSAVPESPNDPRCNGDPPGTVKATARFFSDSSGEDTGVLPLPCQHWRAAGNPEKSTRSYKYLDRLQLDGPCRRVTLKGASVLKMDCSGRGLAAFDFTLTPGVDQGKIGVELTTGNTRFCAQLDDDAGADGSDGKKFKGRNELPPSDCPVP